ncbi:MAG: hypothetical protein ISS25_04635 [Nanoarchaeota archaeon]|nr:hypothetical protein [DPANN group archaeon]MBL7117087.1 hypothetical protein [Nanoarchaeota archaeon]
MVNIKRQTAKKCKIKELLDGRYIKREGWEPNYLETNRGRISRVNILGTIISVEDNTLTIDDGTGKIALRSFDQKKSFSNKKIGDVVIVIGRPRVFNEQKYVVPEIIKKIENLKWIEHRMLELKDTESKPTKEEKIVSEEETTVDITDSLLKKISELDKGYGVKIDEVIKFFEPTTANRTINRLIEEGEIFEIKPGVVKTI